MVVADIYVLLHDWFSVCCSPVDVSIGIVAMKIFKKSSTICDEDRFGTDTRETTFGTLGFALQAEMFQDNSNQDVD